MMGRQIDLSRYHDLSQRMGDSGDPELIDGALALGEDEEELARIAGIVDLFGSRSSGGQGAPSLGLVLQCAAMIVLTTERLVMLGLGARSQFGRHEEDEAHDFVLPWDLVDVISMPVRRSITDRIAGNRTIELFAGLPLISLRIVPQKHGQILGVDCPVTDDEVMALLTLAAAAHRITVSGPDETARLDSLIRGYYTHDGGNAEAWITARDSVGISPHLRGRLVEQDFLH